MEHLLVIIIALHELLLFVELILTSIYTYNVMFIVTLTTIISICFLLDYLYDIYKRNLQEQKI